MESEGKSNLDGSGMHTETEMDGWSWGRQEMV